jgi:hypothetical protein
MKMTFRTAALAAASALVIASTPALAAKATKAPSGPVALIHKTMDDFNHGDIAGFKAAHVDAPTIIDEFAPHMWSGSGAVDSWMAALEKDAKTNGDTDGKIRLGAVTSSHIETDTGYVHINADYLYREHKKAMVEHGGFTFAFTKVGGDWKVAGWTWNGSTPVAAVEAPKLPATAPKAAPPAKPKV